MAEILPQAMPAELVTQIKADLLERADYFVDMFPKANFPYSDAMLEAGELMRTIVEQDGQGSYRELNCRSTVSKYPLDRRDHALHRDVGDFLRNKYRYLAAISTDPDLPAGVVTVGESWYTNHMLNKQPVELALGHGSLLWAEDGQVMRFSKRRTLHSLPRLSPGTIRIRWIADPL